MSIHERNREQRTRFARTPMLVLGFTMTIVYLALGAVLLLDKSLFPGIPGEFRNIFAGMLLVYGLYRGWRVYSDYF
ncbi:MAG: hypothetical protein IPM98_00995 [Lewinellaceae bacterium]|nr:hypothetical protein [Lewinellaceae bacterium]